MGELLAEDCEFAAETCALAGCIHLFPCVNPKFAFILYIQLPYPREALQFFAYIPGAIWTIQHLTDTLVFKDH